MGTPVSQAFTVEGGVAGEPMRHTLAVIDSLHGDGVLPPLVAERQSMKDLNGKFIRGKGVFINTTSYLPDITTAHEIAHVLDNYSFMIGRMESVNGSEMAPVIDAWLATLSYKGLQTLRAQLSQPLNDPIQENRRHKERETVDYLLRPEEVWSRAYAQWVATMSQDPILMNQLTTLRHMSDYSNFFVQWSDEDFKRLGQEIALLFKRKG